MKKYYKKKEIFFYTPGQYIRLSHKGGVVNFFDYAYGLIREDKWRGGITGPNKKPAPIDALSFQIDNIYNCFRDWIPKKYWLSNKWAKPIYDYWNSYLINL